MERRSVSGAAVAQGARAVQAVRAVPVMPGVAEGNSTQIVPSTNGSHYLRVGRAGAINDEWGTAVLWFKDARTA